MTPRRTLAGLIGGGLVAALTLTACSSGSGGSAGTSIGSGRMSDVVTQTVTTSAPAGGSTSAGGPAPTPTTGGSSTPVRSGSPAGQDPSLCSSGRLRLTRDSSDGAAGTQYITWRLTNTGSTTCSMTGYPGFAGLDSRGTVVRQAAQRDPNLTPNSAKPFGPLKVTLIPNASARFVVTTVNVVPSTGCPTEASATTAQVFPPNQTTPVRVAASFGVCQLKVGPLRSIS